MYSTGAVLFLGIWLYSLGLGAFACTNLPNCSDSCDNFEVADLHCQYDYQPYDSKVSCMCEYPYGVVTSNAFAASLNNCTVCNQEFNGRHNLFYYQFWNLVCNSYAGPGGEQIALNLITLPEQQIADMYSSTLLPQLTTSLCGGALSSTPTPAPTPTSSASSVKSTSASVSSEPTPEPTNPDGGLGNAGIPSLRAPPIHALVFALIAGFCLGGLCYHF